MVAVRGLTGLRPVGDSIGRITCPPYDVIKQGTPLETALKNNEDSLFHITLGHDPQGALRRLTETGALLADDVPSFYIYEQSYGAETRTGVFAAAAVSEYARGEIIRHEKTFDDKVKGRLELRAKTGYTFEPVFLLTESPLGTVMQEVKNKCQPVYEFTSDFAGASELHGIRNRIFRVEEKSREGQIIIGLLRENPLYIADGHHRYHASLLNRQSHFLAYICETSAARILAYNRVINGLISFRDVKNRLELVESPVFETPPKHSFAIYTKEGSFLLTAGHIPEDPVERLDCSILEKELYVHLGLTHDMIADSRHFDYYPESDLDKMTGLVNAGKYDLAVALHPVSISELTAVADAGISDPHIVMPEKSTFFSPKILSGIIIYRHQKRESATDVEI